MHLLLLDRVSNQNKRDIMTFDTKSGMFLVAVVSGALSTGLFCDSALGQGVTLNLNPRDLEGKPIFGSDNQQICIVKGVTSDAQQIEFYLGDCGGDWSDGRRILLPLDP